LEEQKRIELNPTLSHCVAHKEREGGREMLLGRPADERAAS